MSVIPIKTALLSVSDKTGLIDFAKRLTASGVKLIASGGTYQALTKANIATTEIAGITQFPEIMGGRIKTLHPKIHGGILARRGQDETVAAEHTINFIDLVVVNLYPFAQTISQPHATLAQAIENIDIGGPAMLRSAAKNHAAVAVVTDIEDYDQVAERIAQSGGVHDTLRQKLAIKAFELTAGYDLAISQYLSNSYSSTDDAVSAVGLGDTFSLTGSRLQVLRYGENPQQRAALYSLQDEQAMGGILDMHQLCGAQLSFNNWVDMDSALTCVQSMTEPACTIVKHANPCGAAFADDLLAAYQKAYSADPISAFGGVIAFNQMIDADLVVAIMAQQFVEVIVAPAAVDIEKIKEVCVQKPKLRVVIAQIDQADAARKWDITSIGNGFLVQQRLNTAKYINWRQVGKVAFTDDQKTNVQLQLAWRLVSMIKSNAIVLVNNGQSIGIGAGQTSRVDSVRIAIEKAQTQQFDCQGAILASDAFFPFRDSIDMLASHSIGTVIQPGGSMRDAEVIAAADAHAIAMLFTDERVFRH